MLQTAPNLIDTHAHLDHSRFGNETDEVILRARNAGVSPLITVGCDMESAEASIDLANRYDDIYATVGIHPHDAETCTPEALSRLRHWATTEKKVVAIGEIGLDFYRDWSPFDAQRQAFREQIRLAREVGLPIVIHDRDAHDETLQILKEEKASEVGGVFHCFSGDTSFARACIDLGFYISFTPNITYPKSDGLREVIRAIPVDHMMVETDCPYMAPQAFRGKRNEPAYVRHAAACIAEVKGLSEEDVARITTLNARSLFRLPGERPEVEIAYKIRNSLYLNITNRCSNHCIFCAKFTDVIVKGHYLGLQEEPTAQEVIAAIGDPSPYDEVVFCGYGEPLLRLALIKEVAGWLKQQGCKVRINTDGQANLVHGRNILPELDGLVDALSVSLNAPDAQQYEELCQTPYGAEGFEAVKDFLKKAAASVPEVVASAVTYPGVDIEACRQLAKSLGVQFRAREYNEVG